MDPVSAVDNLPECVQRLDNSAGTVATATSGLFRNPGAFVLHALSMGVCAVLFLFNTVRFFRERNSGKRAAERQEGCDVASNHGRISDGNIDAAAAGYHRAQHRPATNVLLTENMRCCFRCCSTFSVFFNRRLVCDQCRFFVCRDCVVWEVQMQTWVCKFCYGQANPGSPSYDLLHKKLLDRCRQLESARTNGAAMKFTAAGDEFYDLQRPDNENDSGYIQTMSSATSWDSSIHHHQKCFHDIDMCAPLDTIELEIREALEAIVEQLIGSLDDVTLDQLYRHPEYDRMVEIYHRKLRDALSQLLHSLRMAMRGEMASKTNKNEAVTSDEACLSPTDSHSALKEIISKVIEEAECLPLMVEADPRFLMTTSSLAKDNKGSMDTVDYEDLLATAILNRVIDRYQQKLVDNRSRHKLRNSNPRSHTGATIVTVRSNSIASSNGRISYSAKEIQTDIEERRKWDRSRQADRWTDCSEDDRESTEDFSWARGPGRRSPIEFTVEEKIEEIVSTTVEDDGDDDEDLQRAEAINEPLISRTLLVRDVCLPDLDSYGEGIQFAESRLDRPAAFLELDDHDVVDNVDLESVTSDWQENWIFRNKRSVSPFCNMAASLVIGQEPIAMFVPKPQDNVRAKIGSRDVDELSDMSDGNSLESSLHDNSESDLEAEDQSDDGQQPQQWDDEILHAPSDLISPSEEGHGTVLKVNYDPPVPAPRRSRSPAPSDLQERTSQSSEGRSTLELPTIAKDPRSIESSNNSTTDVYSKASKTSCSSPTVEKERSKWLNPVPMAVNPYSAESIAERTRSSRQNERDRNWVSSSKLTSTSALRTPSSSDDQAHFQRTFDGLRIKIDCGPKKTHLSSKTGSASKDIGVESVTTTNEYHRDYYVPAAAAAAAASEGQDDLLASRRPKTTHGESKYSSRQRRDQDQSTTALRPDEKSRRGRIKNADEHWDKSGARTGQ